MTKKHKSLIWVYPSNNWTSNHKQTFVYGWCNPKAKLYVSCKKRQENKKTRKRINVFPSGNFAQTIKLPGEKNVIKLIQVLDGKEKTITRNIVVKKSKLFSVTAKDPKSNLVLLDVSRKSDRDCHTSLRSIRNEMVIVIDPGHGGKEHGTHSPKGVPEKYYNLQIAKLLFKKLCRGMPRHASTGNVYLTRSKDKFLSLKDRVDFAKKKKANILISIHHNALPDNEDPLNHRGIGVYYTHDFVKPLAKRLLENICKESQLQKYGIFKRNFALTRPDFCYAVLIECGFLIHPIESEIIAKKEIQEKITGGIIKSVLKD